MVQALGEYQQKCACGGRLASKFTHSGLHTSIFSTRQYNNRINQTAKSVRCKTLQAVQVFFIMMNVCESTNGFNNIGREDGVNSLAWSVGEKIACGRFSSVYEVETSCNNGNNKTVVKIVQIPCESKDVRIDQSIHVQKINALRNETLLYECKFKSHQGIFIPKLPQMLRSSGYAFGKCPNSLSVASKRQSFCCNLSHIFYFNFRL